MGCSGGFVRRGSATAETWVSRRRGWKKKMKIKAKVKNKKSEEKKSEESEEKRRGVTAAKGE